MSNAEQYRTDALFLGDRKGLLARVRDLTHAAGLERVTTTLELKAAGGRTLRGYASTFGPPPDHHGDIIDRGAFSGWLERWRAGGKPLPLLDSHSTSSVRSIVGKLTDAREDDHGLFTTFELLDGPDGEEVMRRIKAGLLTGLSIGFHLIQHRTPTAQEKKAGVRRVLQEIELSEISLVVAPANDLARLVADRRSRDPLWAPTPEDMEVEDRLALIKQRRTSMEVGSLLTKIKAAVERIEEGL